MSSSKSWLEAWTDCVGLYLNVNETVLGCKMFTSAQETEIGWQVLVLVFSVVCNMFSFAFLLSKRRKRLEDAPLLMWNILLWQYTNTFILGYLLLEGGVTRFLFHIFGVHTFLEWLTALTMEVYANKRYSCSLYRALGICLVVLYAFCHEMQIIWEPHMMRVAYVGLLGYILDAVGLFFSIKFALQMWKSNPQLGLYCFGAFGSHAFAIVGSLFGCMIHPELHRGLLFGFSMLQNLCSTLAINELV